jgi:hypothetical protein
MALGSLMCDGSVPTMPVRVDSPMAADALEVYRAAMAETQPGELRPPPDDYFDIGSLRVARTVEESKAPNAPREQVSVGALRQAQAGRQSDRSG